MKKTVVLTTLILATYVRVLASFNADSAFINANKAYIDGNYIEAVNAYENIVNQGFVSGELYYNLGNAYFKLSRYPKAILNYERALLYHPRNENYRFNLEKSKVYILDKIDEVPEFLMRRWWNSIVSWYSSDGWSLMSLGLFILGVAGMMIFFLTTRMRLRRFGFYTGFFLILLSMASFGMAKKSKDLHIDHNSGIIMSASVTVKGSPSETSTDLFILHEGTKVYLLEELGQWYEIKISDGKQGWLQKSTIELI